MGLLYLSAAVLLTLALLIGFAWWAQRSAARARDRAIARSLGELNENLLAAADAMAEFDKTLESGDA